MTVKKPESVRYIWNGTEDQKEVLVCRLKQRQFIRRKKDLFALFDQPHETLTVQWNAAFKPHLAYLLYRLFSEGYCTIRGSKGYFAYAEKHFTDFEGNPITPDTLKKLSSKMNKQQKRYADVIQEVEEILNNLG